MKIKLPKDLRGVAFPMILTVELNNFDVDLFLPSLFFKILGEARARGKRSNDATNIKRYIDALAAHPDMDGFSDPEGRRALEGLVRTALVKVGRVGQAHRGEQILSLVPFTLLVHKPGFPTEGRRQRGADTFIYYALKEAVGADDVLLGHVKRVFGHGVNIKGLPELGGSYDGQTELDTLTRISIAFLDGFNSTAVGTKPHRPPHSPCPKLERELATDLVRYLFAYYNLMPVQALTYYLLGLINLELFTYTLKLVHAVNTLVREPSVLPPAMQDTQQWSPPELYLDFTARSGGLSQEMANACVRRDIEAYQQFLASNLRLRLLDKYVEALQRNPYRRAEVERALGAEAGAGYLQGLLRLQNDPLFAPDLNASARADETRIRQENTPVEEGELDPEALQWLDELVSTEETDIDRLVVLLTEAQRKQALYNFVSWYWGAGGIAKPHGILSGTTATRSTWRYAPSNDLLAVLVQLAAARLGSLGEERSNPQDLRPITLREFLQFLEQRFGILVDRPPHPFAGADYAAAARDNAQAMLGRLRQMGIFRDLSDDFTVQRLHPPYVGVSSVSREK
jgi:hypothetical protein